MQKVSSQPGVPEGTAVQWSSTTHRQSRWDWRAVGNFVGGGTGTGLLVSATLLAPTIQSYRVQAALGLGIIALGLLCIMAKLGRPRRALNIFRHVQSSWMTREAFAMPTLFGCGALSLWQPDVGLMAIGASLSALFFLYCQALILREAKGIPAWSEPKIVPLILATGLAEGAGLAALCAAVVPGSVSRELGALLLVALVLRDVAWRRYRKALDVTGTPRETIDVLDNFSVGFERAGQWLPVTLLVAGVWFGNASLEVLAAIAGVLATGTGWSLKYTLVVRAAFYRRKSFSLSAMMATGSAGG
jgi:phenylacetyl-CoA:acceptor oxidoreductase subunit 2